MPKTGASASGTASGAVGHAGVGPAGRRRLLLPAVGGASQLLPGVGGLEPIEESAAELAAFVDRVLGVPGAAKVDLVGASAGTFMSRSGRSLVTSAGRSGGRTVTRRLEPKLSRALLRKRSLTRRLAAVLPGGQTLARQVRVRR